jgi:hypothetical protein
MGALRLVVAVREGQGGRRAWEWWGPRRRGATSCHETGGATFSYFLILFIIFFGFLVFLLLFFTIIFL